MPAAVFSSLSKLVAHLRIAAASTMPYNGKGMIEDRCCADLFDPQVSREFLIRCIFTRDVGYHTGGWWKNPDYERCRHLSLSFRDFATGLIAEQQRNIAKHIAKAFFDDDTAKLWVEPPYSAEGKMRNVYHYRLFCDPAWEAMLPRGEVYTKRFTEVGWKSFSELHDGASCEHHGEIIK